MFLLLLPTTERRLLYHYVATYQSTPPTTTTEEGGRSRSPVEVGHHHSTTVHSLRRVSHQDKKREDTQRGAAPLTRARAVRIALARARPPSWVSRELPHRLPAESLARECYRAALEPPFPFPDPELSPIESIIPRDSAWKGTSVGIGLFVWNEARREGRVGWVGRGGRGRVREASEAVEMAFKVENVREYNRFANALRQTRERRSRSLRKCGYRECHERIPASNLQSRQPATRHTREQSG